MRNNSGTSGDIRELVNYSNRCGEGPIWDNQLNRLLWVDSDGTEIFEYDYDRQQSKIISNDVAASSIVFNKDGLILLGQGVWLWGKNGKKKIIEKIDGESVYFNDSIAGPDGCIYAGTYYWDAEGMKKYGKLYKVKPDCTTERLDEGIVLSNGMAFSPDNELFYYTDSGRRSILVYDFDSSAGSISNKRTFMKHTGDGIPDGLTVDMDGFLWCAMWYEGTVYRFDPDGKVERKIHFPARQISSVAFGGDQMNVLYATSAKDLFVSKYMPKKISKDSKLGGALYYIKTKITGKIENRVAFS